MKIGAIYKEKNFKETAIGKIPKSWEVAKLKDIAYIFSGNTAPQDQKYFQNGKYPFIRVQHLNELEENKYPVICDLVNDLAIKELRLKRFEKGSIIFPKSGESIRLEKRALLKEYSYVVNHLAIIQPFSDEVDRLFLFYWLSTVKTSSYLTKTTMPSLNLYVIKSFLTPIPSLSEQQKIAEILSIVDEAIQKTSEIIAMTERLKKGLMQELLTKGIGHKEFKNTEIGRIPKEWDVFLCSQLCTEITVGIVVTPAKYYTSSGVPCLRSFNIQENEIDPRDLVFISPEANKLHKKSILHVGDVVMVRTGKPGVSSTIPKDFDGANCVDLVIFRPNNGVDPDFLSRFLNSHIARRQILACQTGSVQQHFNIEMAKKLKVACPSLHEQKKIASILSTVDRKFKLERNEKAKLERIKQGLMDLLLTGKIRIKAN